MSDFKERMAKAENSPEYFKELANLLKRDNDRLKARIVLLEAVREAAVTYDKAQKVMADMSDRGPSYPQWLCADCAYTEALDRFEQALTAAAQQDQGKE